MQPSTEDVAASDARTDAQDDPSDFAAYVAARGAGLWRAAWLLTGDAASAEDLVQAALARTWRHHRRIVRQADGSFDAYVRRTLVTTYLSWRGRRWHGEVPTAEAPEVAAADPDVPSSVDVARALATLSPRQRAVVVLRYFEDRTESEVARVLGCSQASVKTHHRRALAALRAGGLLTPDDADPEDPT